MNKKQIIISILIIAIIAVVSVLVLRKRVPMGEGIGEKNGQIDIESSSQKDVLPKFESRLWNLMKVYPTQGLQAARNFAEQENLILIGNKVEVALDIDEKASLDEIVLILTNSYGAEVMSMSESTEAGWPNVIWIRVPIDRLINIGEELDSIHFIRFPAESIPL